MFLRSSYCTLPYWDFPLRILWDCATSRIVLHHHGHYQQSMAGGLAALRCRKLVFVGGMVSRILTKIHFSEIRFAAYALIPPKTEESSVVGILGWCYFGVGRIEKKMIGAARRENSFIVRKRSFARQNRKNRSVGTTKSKTIVRSLKSRLS